MAAARELHIEHKGIEAGIIEGKNYYRFKWNDGETNWDIVVSKGWPKAKFRVDVGVVEGSVEMLISDGRRRPRKGVETDMKYSIEGGGALVVDAPEAREALMLVPARVNPSESKRMRKGLEAIRVEKVETATVAAPGSRGRWHTTVYPDERVFVGCETGEEGEVVFFVIPIGGRVKE